MESNSEPGTICVSGTAWNTVADQCDGESQGLVKIKGKSEMEIFYVNGIEK